MELTLSLLLLAACGALVAVTRMLWQTRDALADAQQARARLEAEAGAHDQRFAFQAQALANMKAEFSALSQRALDHASRNLVELAGNRFENVLLQSREDSVVQRQALDHMVQPITQLLAQQNEAVVALEKRRVSDYAQLGQQIEHMTQANDQLRQQTGQLVTALRRPEQRGRWGELHLQRVVELSGMTEHCDFSTQVSIAGSDGTLRPDMVIQLPGQRRLVVDAKVALDAYLDFAAAPDATNVRLQDHVRQVRNHLRSLASKQYWKALDPTPELVVMYVPVETALATAMTADHALHEEALRDNVLIVGPTLLLALLKTVALSWREAAIADNARQIATLGTELYERLSTWAEHMNKLGKALDTTNKVFNQAVGSLETRVLSSARKLQELNGVVGEPLRLAAALEHAPRLLSSVSDARAPELRAVEPLHLRRPLSDSDVT